MTLVKLPFIRLKMKKCRSNWRHLDTGRTPPSPCRRPPGRSRWRTRPSCGPHTCSRGGADPTLLFIHLSVLSTPGPYRRRAACTSWRPAPRCSLLRSWARPGPGSRPPPRATAASSLLRTPRTNPRHVARLQVEQFYWYLLYLPSDRAPDTDLPETNVIIPSV